ncbi:S-adenosylmethionine--diacylglycerol 3-amino-3-carboxypropyl transferase [Balamuthia mandrillaris]
MVSLCNVLVWVCFWPVLLFRYFLSKVYCTAVNSFLERCYSNQVLFNTAWEDPRIDSVALELTDKDNVLIITSAGCNVLSIALEGCNHVYAIDKNPCQNAVLELKVVAIKELSYDEFWQLFGEGRMPNFSSKVYPSLRKRLSARSRQFWDSHANYFDGKGFRDSFYFRGCSGVLAYAMKLYMKLIPGLSEAMQDLLNAQSLEEQQEIYSSRIEKRLFNPVIMWILSRELVLSIFNGVPAPQRQLIQNEGGLPVFIKRSLQAVMTEIPIKDNYFYRVYINGSYTKDCCPNYLKPELFERLKEGLVDNISIHTCTIEEFLEAHGKQDISRFLLLDHQDWMQANPKVLGREWQQIIDHSTPDARFLWRSASAKAEFVGSTTVKFEGQERKLKDLLSYNSDLAAQLHALDRVHTYASFFIAGFASSS